MGELGGILNSFTLPDASTVEFEREAYLEALFTNLPGTVVIIDRDWRILDINLAGLAMFGVSSLDALPEDSPFLLFSADDLPKLQKEICKIFDGENCPVSEAFRLKVNPLVGLQQLHEYHISPLKDEQGRTLAAVLSGREATKWQDAFDEADRTSSILHSILTTVPDAMVVIDENGLMASFSKTAEKLFGYSEAEVLGKNVSMLMPAPFQEEHDGYLERYLTTGEKRIIGAGREVKAERKDGTIFPMRLEVGEAIVGDRRLFTGFIHDLTGQHKSEEQMLQLQSELMHASRLSAVGTLASSLAHELNQPLTAIANYLSAGRDMLDDLTPETAGQLQEALRESAAEAVRAGKIVHRLRDFVSKSELTMEVLSMAELVNDSTTLGLIDARLKGVEYSFDIHPDINHVIADKIQIQQVMVNLMRNAIEAMADSPVKKLTVTAHSAPHNRVEFIVQDTGPGISPEVSDRLFEPFASTKGDGMGLGLSICKSIIAEHGGELAVDPAPGGGTMFRFSLLKAPKEHPHGG